MKAKEKAITLVNDFGRLTMYNYDNAKQCALIAVDEILNSLNSDRISYGSEYRYEESDFWNEVKTEIELL
jgi:hypothetical protein